MVINLVVIKSKLIKIILLLYTFIRNPDVRTVEDEIEKVLFKLGLISPCNFGNYINNIHIKVRYRK